MSMNTHSTKHLTGKEKQKLKRKYREALSLFKEKETSYENSITEL